MSEEREQQLERLLLLALPENMAVEWLMDEASFPSLETYLQDRRKLERLQAEEKEMRRWEQNEAQVQEAYMHWLPFYWRWAIHFADWIFNHVPDPRRTIKSQHSTEGEK